LQQQPRHPTPLHHNSGNNIILSDSNSILSYSDSILSYSNSIFSLSLATWHRTIVMT